MHIYHWMQLLDINIREQPQLSGYRMHLMVSQWVMGSNPIRVTGGGVRNDIGPLLLCSSAPLLQRQISPNARSEESPIQDFSQM